MGVGARPCLIQQFTESCQGNCRGLALGHGSGTDMTVSHSAVEESCLDNCHGSALGHGTSLALSHSAVEESCLDSCHGLAMG